jgi:hypothetical protein
MTAITIWYNNEIKEHPGLWVAADSRVSADSNSVLINDASKIFGLPIICRSPDSSGFFTNVSFNHTYGYCFAGSTLMGQNTYLSLLPLLSNLVVEDSSNPPSMAEVSEFVLKFSRRSFEEYRIRVGQPSLFEAALFGWCQSKQRLYIFHYFPKLVNGVYSLICAQNEFKNLGDFIYLGDEKAKMSKLISQGFLTKPVPGRPISRMPRYIIEDQIEKSLFPSIGGDIQLAVSNIFGYQPYLLCKPIERGKPDAYFSYLGRALTEDIRYVGQAMVGGPAIV